MNTEFNMVETSTRVRHYFEKARGDIDLYSFWRFPTGACEGASLFLGKILHELFPESEILYICGNKPSGEKHFWLNVEGLIYDITADQFPEVSKPLFASIDLTLVRLFGRHEKHSIEEAFLKSDVTTSTYKKSLMMELRFYLT